jgi:UDP-3-O-[3-hydroxymyristoyl] glucosamine N-acyltransferase
MDTRRVYTVADLASHVGGTLFGQDSTVITAATSLEAAHANAIVFAEGRQALRRALGTPAGAIISDVRPDVLGPPVPGGRPFPAVIFASRARRAMAEACQLLFEGYPREAVGRHPTAVVDPTATLGEGVAVGPHVVVGPRCRVGGRTTLRAGVVLDEGAAVGDDCYLFPGVVIGPNCVIGARSIIHPNAVVGGEGFGFVAGEDYVTKQPQFGRVVVGTDCEIGACCTLDRGTFDDTVLGDDVKLDNLVQVGHNVRIGSHVQVSAQTAFAGRAEIGDYALIAGQVGIYNGIRVGERGRVKARAGVLRNVPPGGDVWGHPARGSRAAIRETLLIERLPKMARELERLRARVAALENAEGPRGT